MATKSKREKRKVDASRRIKEHKSSGGFTRTAFHVPDGMELFKFEKAGVHRIDIIPFKAGKGNPFADEGEWYFERTYFCHPRIGAEEQPYVCLKKTFKKKCPCCQHQKSLADDPDIADTDVKAMAPKERQLWLVYDRANPDKGVQIWDVSNFLFGKLLDARIKNADEDENYALFASPDTDGYTLKLEVVEESFGGNKFFKVSAIDFKERKEPIPEEILDQAVCLDDLLIETSYDDLRAVLFQMATDDDEGNESSGGDSKKKPKKNGSPSKTTDADEDDDDEDEDDKPAKKKPVKKDDDDDDEDEDEDEDDDDDDDKPAKKPAKKKPAKDDDEDEDDDDDDDDDEPVKKKPAKKPTKKDDDEDDDDDGDDEPKKKPAKKEKKPAKKPARSKDDDDDDEDWDEDDDD